MKRHIYSQRTDPIKRQRNDIDPLELRHRAVFLEEVCRDEDGAFDRIAKYIALQNCDVVGCWILRKPGPPQCLGQYTRDETIGDIDAWLRVEDPLSQAPAWPLAVYDTSSPKEVQNGLLVLKFDDSKQQSSAEHHKDFQLLAKQVGIAIHTATGISLAKQADYEDKVGVEHVEHEQNYRAALDTIVQDLQSSSSSFEQLFRSCAQAVQSAFACDGVIISRLDKDQVLERGERRSIGLGDMPKCIGSFLDRLIKAHPQGVAYVYDTTALFQALEKDSPNMDLGLRFLTENQWSSLAAAYACHRGSKNGVVVITYGNKRCWSASDEKLLHTIAIHLSVAIAQTDYVEQESRYKQRLEQEIQRVSLLTQLVQEIRSSLDMNTVFATSARLLAEAFDMDRCNIWSSNTDNIEKSCIQGGYCKPEVRPVTSVSLPECIMKVGANRWRSGKPACLEDVREELDKGAESELYHFLTDSERNLLKEYYVELNVRGCAFYGTTYANSPNGYVVLHTSKRREWTADDVQMLMTVADQIAIALSHAALIEKERNRSQVLQREVDRGRAIDTIVAEIRMQLDTAHILKTCTKRLAEFLTATRCYICRMNECSTDLVVIDKASEYWRGQLGPLEGPEVLTMFQKLYGWWKEKEEETAGHSCLFHKPVENEGADEDERVYGVQISHQGNNGNCTGNLVMVVHMTKEGALANHDDPFLLRVASQIGIALAQAEMMESERRRAIALQRSLERSSVLSAVVQAIRSSLDKETVLKNTARLLTLSFGALRCIIQTGLPLEDAWRPGVSMEESLHFVHYNADWAPSLRNRPYPRARIKQLKTIWSSREDKATVLVDIRKGLQDPSLTPDEEAEMQSFYSALHVNTSIFCRCSYMQETNAVLFIHFGPEPCDFPTEDLEFVQSVAMQVGIGLHHAHILQIEKHQRDLLAQKNVELEMAKAEAENSAKAKSDFLSVCTHELRTPMCSVLGFANLLLDSNLTPMQRDYIQTIIKSGQSLVDLISDILDCGKIEHGKLELEFAPMEIRSVVEGVVDLLTPASVEKGLQISYYIDPTAPVSIISDAKRIRQVLINLCGNAIKFTDSGEISIRVMNTASKESRTEPPQPGDRSEVRFTVQDTGRGIKEEDRGKLFLFFQQLDSSKARRYDGAGIGLYLSKTIASMLGGDLTLESSDGPGSSFAFVVRSEVAPFTSPLYSPLPTDHHPPIVQVLIQHSLIYDSIVDALKQWGLCLASTNVDSQKPEVIIYDDTYTTEDLPPAQFHIRLTDPTQSLDPPPPSYSCDLSSPGPCSAKGVHLIHLRKPPHLQSLRDAFIHFLQTKYQPQTQTTGPLVVMEPTPPLPSPPIELGQRCPMTILLAEDHPVNAKIILLMLKKLGYDCSSHWVLNGLQVLDALHKQKYDMILLDWQMPDMDGLTVLQRIIEEYGQKGPYVAMLTANVSASDRALCLGTGANAFLTKPICIPELADTLVAAYQTRCSTRAATSADIH